MTRVIFTKEWQSCSTKEEWPESSSQRTDKAVLQKRNDQSYLHKGMTKLFYSTKEEWPELSSQRTDKAVLPLRNDQSCLQKGLTKLFCKRGMTRETYATIHREFTVYSKKRPNHFHNKIESDALALTHCSCWVLTGASASNLNKTRKINPISDIYFPIWASYKL